MLRILFTGLLSTWLLTVNAGVIEDAVKSANYTARSTVQNIYRNLAKVGYEWPKIRDRNMPKVLSKVINIVKQQAEEGMGQDIIVKHFLPTYVASYYDEIAKIQAENQLSCLDITFVADTLVTLLKRCQLDSNLGGKVFPDVVESILDQNFDFSVCGVPSACQKSLSDSFAILNDLKNSKFDKICKGSTSKVLSDILRD